MKRDYDMMVQSCEDEITGMCESLGLLPTEKRAPSVPAKAIRICKAALSDKAFLNSRIQLKSIQIASIYIAAQDEHAKVNQYDLAYKFRISPMTIRKVYHRISRIIKKKVVG